MNLLSAHKGGRELEIITLLAVHEIGQEREQEIQGKIDQECKLTSRKECVSYRGQQRSRM